MEQLGWRLAVGRAVTGPWPAPPCPASPWDWGQPVRALPTHLAVPKPLLPEPPNVPANSHWPHGGLRLPRDAPGRLRWSEQGGLQGNGLRGTSNPQWGPSGPSGETTERCTQHPSAPPCRGGGGNPDAGGDATAVPYTPRAGRQSPARGAQGPSKRGRAAALPRPPDESHAAAPNISPAAPKRASSQGHNKLPGGHQARRAGFVPDL